MNKLFTKIASLALGTAMAFGVGLTVSGTKAKTVDAGEGDTVYTLNTSVLSSWGTSYGNKDAVTAYNWTSNCAIRQTSSPVGIWLGANNNNKAKMTMGNGSYSEASAIATAISATTSATYYTAVFQRANGTELANIGSVVVEYNSVGNGTPDNCWVVYSTDNGTTWSIFDAVKTSVTASMTFTNTSTIESGLFGVVFSRSGWFNVRLPVVTFKEGATSEMPDDATLDSLYVVSDPSNLEYYDDATDSEIDYTGASIKAHYTSSSQPSWNTDHSADVSLTNSDLTWSIDMSELELTVSYTDENDDTASYIWTVTSKGERPLAGEMSSFSTITGSVTGTGNRISYAAAQGTAGTAPVVNTNQIRIYQNGGTLTVSSIEGYKLTSVTIGSAMTTTVTYSVDGGTTSSGQSISANDTFLLDNIEASSVLFTCTGTTSSSRLYLNYLAVTYKTAAVITPTKAIVSFNSGFGTYYCGSTLEAKYTFSTAHITVNTYDDSDNLAHSYSLGTGFTVAINGTPLDATSAIATLSVNAFSAGTYAVSVTADGVNNSSQNPTVYLTVVAKDTTALAWSTEQTGTFVSYAQKLHIDGIFTPTWNDGSNTSSHPVTTEVYTGSSAVEANKIYSASKSYAEHTAGFDITAANIEGKTLSVDSEYRLNYSSATTFYIQMYYTQYAGAKIGKVVNVVLPTLYAEDANEFNYYVGSTYQTAASVSLKYDNQVVRTLTNEFTLSPSSVTPVNTNNISVTVTFSENTNITTTYSITPKEPAVLEEIELYNNSGAAMTSGEDFVSFNAGENFHLFNKNGESYFAYVLDSEAEEYYISTYSDFKFELLASASATSGSGTAITTSTYMRKGMDTKWIRATYSQGASSVSCTFQLDIEDATVDAYSEGSLANYYEKISSLSELGDSADCIIAITIDSTTYAYDGRDVNNGYTEVTVDSDNRITYSDDMAKLACVISTVTGGYAIQISASSDNNAGKYISGTSRSNTTNFNTDPVTLSISATSGRTSTGGSWDAQSNTSVLSFQTANSRFRFYKSTTYITSGYYAVDFYKRAGSSGTGNKITYLEQVIDAYRLNTDVSTESEGLSVCSEDSGIYSSDYWKGTNNKVSVKTLFNALTAAELSQLAVQDKFGEEGMTYVDTYQMLIAKEQLNSNSLLKTILGESSSTVAVTVIVAMIGLSAVGGYFFLRKRKEI